MKRSIGAKVVTKELQYFSDKTAALDMAAAFGYGARGAKGGEGMTWNLDALLDGKNFLARRLAKKRCDYWRVRAKALDVAAQVGEWAAAIAQEDPHRDRDNFVVIEREHMQKALGKLRRSGPGASRPDCPF